MSRIALTLSASGENCSAFKVQDIVFSSDDQAENIRAALVAAIPYVTSAIGPFQDCDEVTLVIQKLG